MTLEHQMGLGGFHFAIKLSRNQLHVLLISSQSTNNKFVPKPRQGHEELPSFLAFLD